MEKDFLKNLGEYTKAQDTERQRPRKDKNVVEFLAVIIDIQKAMEVGYSIKSIWGLLQREEKITYQYETFAKHVRRHIRGLKTDQKPIRATTKGDTKKIQDATESRTAIPEQEKRGFTFNPNPRKEDYI